jgi:beta-N-acetylhexosaminidase
MEYRGLIVSDDMEMGGILTQVSIEEAAVQSVLAGAHLIEICKDPSLLHRAYEALLTEAERSEAFSRIVTLAANKILRFKRKRLAPRLDPPPQPSHVERLCSRVAAFRKRVSVQPREVTQ